MTILFVLNAIPPKLRYKNALSPTSKRDVILLETRSWDTLKITSGSSLGLKNNLEDRVKSKHVVETPKVL